MRSQYAFTATSIGTASSVPQMPQTNPQKISPTKTAMVSVTRAIIVPSQTPTKWTLITMGLAMSVI